MSRVMIRRVNNSKRRRCVCRDPGAFNCQMTGVLAGLPNENGARYIERCDACETFGSDELACKAYASVYAGVCAYDLELKAIWIPL
jgi:hypothetical protein